MRSNPIPNKSIGNRRGDGPVIAPHARRPDNRTDLFEMEAGMLWILAPQAVVFQSQSLNRSRQPAVGVPELGQRPTNHGISVVRPAWKSAIARRASLSSGPPGWASRLICSSHNRDLYSSNQVSSSHTWSGGNLAISASSCSTLLMSCKPYTALAPGSSRFVRQTTPTPTERKPQ